jgi:hypothetical protein
VHERFTDGQSFAQKTNSTQWQMDDPPRIQKLLRWFGRTNTRMFWGSHQPDGSTFTSKQVPLFPQEKFFCQFFAKHRLLLDISRHHHLHDLHHQHGLSLRLKVSTSPPTSLSSLSPASFLSSSSPSPPSYII